MHLPVNRFKRALRNGQHQLGFWLSLADAYSAEAVSGAGFDWLLLDTEHSPNDLRGVLAQLQAVSAYPTSPAVRLTHNDTIQQKRLLDIGAQTLLIPYVQTEADAIASVGGMRYAPAGIRGMGGSTRANGFGRISDYVQACQQELCLLVQIEDQIGLTNLEAIARVDGVDGVFVGPADLAASLGHAGDPSHPVVQDAIHDALQRIKACGKAPGIITSQQAHALRYMEMGSLFTAVGTDIGLLAREVDKLAKSYRRLGS